MTLHYCFALRQAIHCAMPSERDRLGSARVVLATDCVIY
jgi:hypothetical protein